MKLLTIIKFIKRLLINLPYDFFSWGQFYVGRSPVLSHIEDTLTHYGYASLPGILSRDDLVLLTRVSNDLDLELAMFNEGQQTGRIFSQGLVDDRVAPIVCQFRPIAQRHLNTSRVKLELTYFQLSRPQDAVENIPGGSFHLDDNKPNIKFFVYLSDVGPTNGPFKVIPGSHGLKLKKIMRYIRWTLFKKRSDLYADKDLGSAAAGAMPILGDKGFCFAVDTTAWHMAEPVISGERRVFVASFNMI